MNKTFRFYKLNGTIFLMESLVVKVMNQKINETANYFDALSLIFLKTAIKRYW